MFYKTLSPLGPQPKPVVIGHLTPQWFEPASETPELTPEWHEPAFGRPELSPERLVPGFEKPWRPSPLRSQNNKPLQSLSQPLRSQIQPLRKLERVEPDIERPHLVPERHEPVPLGHSLAPERPEIAFEMPEQGHGSSKRAPGSLSWGLSQPLEGLLLGGDGRTERWMNVCMHRFLLCPTALCFPLGPKPKEGQYHAAYFIQRKG